MEYFIVSIVAAYKLADNLKIVLFQQKSVSYFTCRCNLEHKYYEGAQWLSGRVFDSKPKGRWFEPHRRHCVVSLSKNINPSLVLVQHRKTRPYITERLLMGRKEPNQTNKINTLCFFTKVR